MMAGVCLGHASHQRLEQASARHGRPGRESREGRLREHGEQRAPRFVETVPRRGYLFSLEPSEAPAPSGASERCSSLGLRTSGILSDMRSASLVPETAAERLTPSRLR